ncbi:hypothetical protein ACTFIR_010240 [Dictyostelium discoideum]
MIQWFTRPNSNVFTSSSKVNKDEPDSVCAIREIFKETYFYPRTRKEIGKIEWVQQQQQQQQQQHKQQQHKQQQQHQGQKQPVQTTTILTKKESSITSTTSTTTTTTK